ncbi:formylglycine-generating enzyme family protein [Roseiconus nitratireducens]|uniref:Formylglycine-generating enzyme family protein n=1 Tax=Roseiconus nitratireducens TaxID=2605748 RepID=A0A5M6CVI7_9BACT|nr:formylglycine-generating enzyme family protein [Roseiconus nitratireducens]KAA5539063.1 formylglycine-generating enzyme family protein [Roseiconus nitratireducens]
MIWSDGAPHRSRRRFVWAARVVCLLMFLTAFARRSSAQEAVFVPVPAGEYRRGESDMNAINHDHPYSVKLKGNATWSERPKHWVKLTSGFEIADREVTVEQFAEFVRETGYETDAEQHGNAAGFDSQAERPPGWIQIDPKYTWRSPGFTQGPDHPVVCVSWNDANAYCRWRSKREGRRYRLPTEAEWEYAARAGTDSWYSWGNSPDDAYEFANVADASLERLHPQTTMYQRSLGLDSPACDDGHPMTAPVASFRPNPWGLHDMHGNVWEWCQDIFQEDHYAKLLKPYSRQEAETVRIEDPAGPPTTEQQQHGDWRVLRGGSWYVGPISCRSAMRGFAEAGDGLCYAGFRLVRDVPDVPR